MTETLLPTAMSGREIIGWVALFRAAVSLLDGMSTWHRQGRLRRAAGGALCQVTESQVAVKGVAHAGLEGLVEGAFTGKACLCVSWGVGEIVMGVTETPSASGFKGRSFLLRDDSGEIVVDPAGARLEVATGDEVKAYWGKVPNARVQRFLDAEGLSPRGAIRTARFLRYQESRIEPGPSASS